MAFDAFVKIDGIEGESTDDKHPGWIEITNYGMVVSQTVSRTASSSGGATAERVDFTDLSFTKQLDKSTPKLALACANGTHIDKVTIELCRAGTDKIKFMEYKLSDCIISAVSTFHDDEANDLPTESISINYGKIEWSYTQQKRKGGGAAGNVSGGWDLEKNCKV